MPVRDCFRTPSAAAVLLAAPAVFLAACGGGGTSNPQATVTVTAPGGSGGGGGGGGLGGSSSPSTPVIGRPRIIAVTTAGALVQLDPRTGSVTQTLIPNRVLGDEIAVSPNGSTIYFALAAGCNSEVESISMSGGTPTAIAPGELPAISPDGTKLAFTSEPLMTQTCTPDPSKPAVAAEFNLIIRTLSSGAQQVLPLPAQVRRGGLLPPISHLSWAADNTRVAVSTSAVQDNEGWAVYIVDTSVAKSYLGPAPGVTDVPVTGSPTPQRSYLREGIFLPDGNLFVSRACCGGVPVSNTSRLMWVVDSSGNLVHQVAIGFPSLDHVSLAADSSGQWLLYLANHDLYVSHGGNKPSLLSTGFIAATWQ